MLIGDLLARLNAVLNTTSFILLVVGYVMIRRKRAALHARCMKGAFLASALFLVSYLARYAMTGAHHLAAHGWVKAFYLVVLFSHMLLAMVVVPLVLRTLFLAWKERFSDHKAIARWTLPVWIYVSLTGVVVYAMLYHIVGSTP